MGKALQLGNVLHPKSKYSTALVLHRDFVRHISHSELQHLMLGTVMSVTAIRLQYVMWFAIFSPINRRTCVFAERKQVEGSWISTHSLVVAKAMIKQFVRPKVLIFYPAVSVDPRPVIRVIRTEGRHGFASRLPLHCRAL